MPLVKSPKFKRSLVFILIVALVGLIITIGIPVQAQEASEEENYLAPQTNTNLVDMNLLETRFNTYQPATTMFIYQYDNARAMGTQQLFKEWYKEVYYDFIVHKKFADLPFNYVLTDDGSLWQGKSGFYDVQPDLVAADEAKLPGVVLVWLPQNITDETAVRRSLQALINTYRIKEAFQIGISIKQGAEAETSRLTVTEQEPYSGGLSFADGNLAKRNYSISVEQVEYPKETKQGVDFVVNLTLTNKSQFPIYNETPYNFYVATCDPKDKKSPFAEDDTWSTESRVTGFTDEYILPNKAIPVDYKISNPLRAGEYKETFCPLIQPNNWLTDAKYTVEFTSQDTGLDLVKVNTQGFGFVNVRKSPNYTANIEFKLTDEDVVVDLERQLEWVHIRTKNGKEGWMVRQYLEDF